MAPRALPPSHRDSDELPVPAAPEDDESEAESGAYGELDLPDPHDDDPLDDATAAIGDDGLEVDEPGDVARDEVDDAGVDASVFAPDLGFGAFALEPDLEEPGVGFDAIEVDDAGGYETVGDRGEEGPSEEDDELRAEDLPALDADDDGDVAESTLYETALFVPSAREAFGWADRAWEVDRAIDGVFDVGALGPDGAYVAGPSGLVALAATGAVRVLAVAPCPERSIAVGWDDGAILAGGGAVHALRGERWERLVDAPVRVVGTASGIYGLGRKGALLHLRGSAFVPADSARPSRRDLSAEDARLWVHALGVSAEHELCAVVLDDATGDLVLERGASARIALRGIGDDPAPAAVHACAAALALETDGGEARVAFDGAAFGSLPGARGCAGLALVPHGDGAAALVALADDAKVSLVLYAEGRAPAVVAVLEPRAEPDEDVASSKVALVADGARVVVGTVFGVFVVRPPQRAG